MVDDILHFWLGGSETEDQLQFSLELCADTSSTNSQTSSKISGIIYSFFVGVGGSSSTILH